MHVQHLCFGGISHLLGGPRTSEGSLGRRLQLRDRPAIALSLFLEIPLVPGRKDDQLLPGYSDCKAFPLGSAVTSLLEATVLGRAPAGGWMTEAQVKGYRMPVGSAVNIWKKSVLPLCVRTSGLKESCAQFGICGECGERRAEILPFEAHPLGILFSGKIFEDGRQPHERVIKMLVV